MKVVIDTNVLIDGDQDENSHANKILGEVLEGRIQAFANKKTMQENSGILHKLIKNSEYLRRVEEMLGQVGRVSPERVDAVPNDRQDTKILASAVAAQADYLITSDHDLLDIEEYRGIKIIDPVSFWNVYRQENLGENDWQKFINQFLK